MARRSSPKESYKVYGSRMFMQLGAVTGSALVLLLAGCGPRPAPPSTQPYAVSRPSDSTAAARPPVAPEPDTPASTGPKPIAPQPDTPASAAAEPAATAPGASAFDPSCATRPPFLVKQMQSAPEADDPCELDPEGDDVMQEVGKTAAAAFRVTYAGPSGSGRFWTVAVSTGAEDVRRCCFDTTTVGWRMVAGDSVLARPLSTLIRWVQDVDGDGDDELVVRASFPLHSEASLASYGLTVFAYDLLSDRFVLDAPSTRTLQQQIAEAYERAALRQRRGSSDRERRMQAARILRQCMPR